MKTLLTFARSMALQPRRSVSLSSMPASQLDSFALRAVRHEQRPDDVVGNGATFESASSIATSPRFRGARGAFALAVVVVVAACAEPPAQQVTPPLTTERDLPTDVVVVDGHPDIAPPDIVEPPLPGARARKRMDLDQLNAALRAATGGIGWVENNNDQLVALSATLGRPDFLTTTEEDLTPSPLFQKFLGDASRKVCADLFVAEASRANEDRAFFVNVDKDETTAELGARLDDNLARLLLRFHGRRSDSETTRGALDGWRFLFQSTERAASPAAAWGAVCLGLLQHPDFYTY